MAEGNSRRVALIGAGNIGSRHLQGLARSSFKLDILAVEPSAAAREVAARRFAGTQGAQRHHLSLLETIDALPPHVDLLIHATAADARAQTTRAFFTAHAADAVIFEKILFQTIEDHADIERLLVEHGVRAWVNTPRRCWPDYVALRERVSGRGPIVMRAVAAAADRMATSAIHWLDLLSFLRDDRSDFRMDGRRGALTPDHARHPGSLELVGHLIGLGDCGDLLVLNADPQADFAETITLVTDRETIIICEATASLRLTPHGGAPTQELGLRTVYQSDMTGAIVDDILRSGDCQLPSYGLSARLHRSCLEAFLQAMGFDRGDVDTVCPVT